MSEFSGVKSVSDSPPDTSLDFRESEAKCLSVALVNNMPNAAVEVTELQFRTRIAAAADGLLVRLAFYMIPEIPRTEAVQQRMQRYYRTADDLWQEHFDGLIVTGTEPQAANLTEEPYWGTHAKLVDWASRNTDSAIWSCLAAHAAVLHLDGLSRRRLPEKRFGVFKCAKLSEHILLRSVPAHYSMPHSRWNEIPQEAIETCGYLSLGGSGEAGLDVFIKEGRSLFIFFQGHPEYEAETLLLEYRRDIRRFLKGEQEHYPAMPKGYFDSGTTDVLLALRERLLSDRRKQWLDDFPFGVLFNKIQNSWSPTASGVYRNWLLYLSAQKERRLRIGARCSTKNAMGTGQAA